jgi:hypothetical protein
MTITKSESREIRLTDGSHVRLTEPIYYIGDCVYAARGYLSTEDQATESGPTVTVCWEARGMDNEDEDADWGNPSSIEHCSLGDLKAA